MCCHGERSRTKGTQASLPAVTHTSMHEGSRDGAAVRQGVRPKLVALRRQGQRLQPSHRPQVQLEPTTGWHWISLCAAVGERHAAAPQVNLGRGGGDLSHRPCWVVSGRGSSEPACTHVGKLVRTTGIRHKRRGIAVDCARGACGAWAAGGGGARSGGGAWMLCRGVGPRGRSAHTPLPPPIAGGQATKAAAPTRAERGVIEARFRPPGCSQTLAFRP